MTGPLGRCKGEKTGEVFSKQFLKGFLWGEGNSCFFFPYWQSAVWTTGANLISRVKERRELRWDSHSPGQDSSGIIHTRIS